MPKKHNTKEIRDTVGALDFAHVAASEIHKRLNDGTAGLQYKVPISERQVFNYRLMYRDIHGMPPEGDAADPLESIDNVLDRITALLSREVTAFEAKRRGSMTKERLAVLKDMHGTLSRWRKQEGSVSGRLRQNQITPKGRKDTTPPKEESAIQKLARQEREAREDADLAGSAVG